MAIDIDSGSDDEMDSQKEGGGRDGKKGKKRSHPKPADREEDFAAIFQKLSKTMAPSAVVEAISRSDDLSEAKSSNSWRLAESPTGRQVPLRVKKIKSLIENVDSNSRAANKMKKKSTIHRNDSDDTNSDPEETLEFTK